MDELGPVVEWIQQLRHPHKLVVAGNHDRCFEHDRARAEQALGPTVQYLQDSGTTIGNLRFWGSPWQPAYDNWAFNLPRGQALRNRWALIPADTDVLITHGLR